MNTQESNKKRTQAELRILNKVYEIRDKVYVLHVTYKIDELIGYDNQGFKVYRPKKKEQLFYGMCKSECLEKMKKFLVIDPVQYHKHSELVYA